MEAEPSEAAGQAAPATSPEITQTAPQGGDGQSATPSQTTSSGPDTGNTDTFFDPKDILGTPLETAYKQMQGAYTKKSQSLKEQQNKVQAYDAFMRDPEGTIRQLAKQNGWNLVQGAPDSQDDNPQTWEDVYSRAKKEVLKELDPVLSEVRQMKQQNIESYLDNKYPDWRTYEDGMLELLQAHPTLAKEPDRLYDLAVPPEVREARMMKAARAKLTAASENGQVSGPSATSKSSTSGGPPPVGSSFNDFVAYAKKQLAEKGMKPGLS